MSEPTTSYARVRVCFSFVGDPEPSKGLEALLPWMAAMERSGRCEVHCLLPSPGEATVDLIRLASRAILRMRVHLVPEPPKGFSAEAVRRVALRAMAHVNPEIAIASSVGSPVQDWMGLRLLMHRDGVRVRWGEVEGFDRLLADTPSASADLMAAGAAEESLLVAEFSTAEVVLGQVLEEWSLAANQRLAQMSVGEGLAIDWVVPDPAGRCIQRLAARAAALGAGWKHRVFSSPHTEEVVKYAGLTYAGRVDEAVRQTTTKHLIVVVISGLHGLSEALKLLTEHSGVVEFDSTHLGIGLPVDGVEAMQRLLLASGGPALWMKWREATEPEAYAEVIHGIRPLVEASSGVFIRDEAMAEVLGARFEAGVSVPFMLLPSDQSPRDWSEVYAHLLIRSARLAGMKSPIAAAETLAAHGIQENAQPWLEANGLQTPVLRGPRMFLAVPTAKGSAAPGREILLQGLVKGNVPVWTLDEASLSERLFWAAPKVGWKLPAEPTRWEVQVSAGDELLVGPEQVVQWNLALLELRKRGLMIGLFAAFESTVLRATTILERHPQLIDRVHCARAHADLLKQACASGGCAATLVVYE